MSRAIEHSNATIPSVKLRVVAIRQRFNRVTFAYCMPVEAVAWIGLVFSGKVKSRGVSEFTAVNDRMSTVSTQSEDKRRFMRRPLLFDFEPTT